MPESRKANGDAWVEQVYAARSSGELTKLYDRWADTYDADMQGLGYVHPAVIAAFSARYVTDPTAAILDAGCGTGTVGQILSVAGYSNLMGLDLSEGMLARARARDVYARLEQCVLGEELPFETGSITAIISTGTFTTGHAPASAFDELSRITKPGGYLIFTVGTTVWSEAGFSGKLAALCEEGILAPAETSKIYHPMPNSEIESGFTTRAHVYRRS